MKKTIVLLLLFLVSFSNLNAQKKLSITFRDGKIIEGYGRFMLGNKVLYKKNKRGNKEIYNYKTIKKLTLDGDNYEYKVSITPSTRGRIMLLKSALVGKINLYRQDNVGVSTPIAGMNGISFSSETTTYHISRNDEDTAISLRKGNIRSKRFKKIAQKYFATCPDLLDKIETKYFKRFDIESVVMYYNKCFSN